MVGSFIILAIVIIIRVIAETLVPKFTWLSQFIPYINYALIVLSVLFATFVIIAIVKAIKSSGKK